MHNDNYRGHIAMLTANIIFGLNTPIAKTVLRSELIGSFALSFFRMAGAALLFWVASIFTKREKVTGKDLILLFFASLLGIQCNQILFLYGLSMTSPIDASIVATMVPIITMIFAALFVKEPITLKKAGGVFLGFSGAILLILGGNLAFETNGNMNGNLICLASALSFATYLTVFKGLISRYSPVTLMKWMFLFAAVCCTPISWKEVAAVDYGSLTTDLYLRIIYVVAMATFVAYFLIPIGQKNLRPTLVSIYNYLQPFVASIVAVVLGIGVLGWSQGVAAGLIFLGVWLVTMSKSRAQVEAEKNLRS